MEYTKISIQEGVRAQNFFLGSFYLHLKANNKFVPAQRPLERYESKGIKDLYIKKEEESRFRLFMKESADAFVYLQEKTEIALERICKQIYGYVEARMKSKEYFQIWYDYKQVYGKPYWYHGSHLRGIFALWILYRVQTLPEKEIIGTLIAGSVCDFGFLDLPRYLHRLDPSLSNKEWDIYESHVRRSLVVLKTFDLLDFLDVQDFVFQHHEQANGNGFPSRNANPSHIASALCFASKWAEIVFQHPTLMDSLEATKNWVMEDRRVNSRIMEVFF